MNSLQIRWRRVELTEPYDGVQTACFTGLGRMMKTLMLWLCVLTVGSPAGSAWSAEFKILSVARNGILAWDNAFTNGVCTLEMALAPQGPWLPQINVFTTNANGSFRFTTGNSRAFYRLSAVDISGTSRGFSNLCSSYSIIRTIAGKGDFGTDGFNGWDPRFEGGLATEAELSRPHIAMADDAGNIYIADKDAHAIRKVSLDGRIFTVAGTNIAGDDGDKPALGIQRRLSSPNGLWVRGDGTVYILDTGNGKVRRLDINGVITTLFSVSDSTDVGRGLWVSNDETLAYVASGKSVKRWTPGAGVKTFENGFVDLGNLVVDPSGRLVVTDRGDNRVYRLSSNGNKTVIAGNGDTTGGGDGELALNTGLWGVRGVWFLPNGGYFLATHEGSQIWYVDTAGVIHLFVDGSRSFHEGDGEYFRTPGYKVSEVRATTMDKQGNLIITEHDSGYIRMIRFLRWIPTSE
jgi:sugar lactone lactonase YvrE